MKIPTSPVQLELELERPYAIANYSLHWAWYASSALRSDITLTQPNSAGISSSTPPSILAWNINVFRERKACSSLTLDKAMENQTIRCILRLV
jgi:hypothetical protein